MGIELATSGSAVRHVTDCTTRPGRVFFKFDLHGSSPEYDCMDMQYVNTISILKDLQSTLFSYINKHTVLITFSKLYTLLEAASKLDPDQLASSQAI